jgi:uncharacterized protein YbjT (DUF2867 family)
LRTLTNHPRDAVTGIETRPLAFDDPARLLAAFEGVTTFYNTYWMRTGDSSGYATAVRHSKALVTAAAAAGVERIVHLSVAHPSLDSPYAYFRAKAEVEEAIRASGVPAAILRPALIFGGDAALIENLAWILRRAPVFGIAGDGSYKVRPVFVDDVAAWCVAAGQRRDDETADAVGPERLTFFELVTHLRDALGARTRLVRMPAGLVLASSRAVGAVLRDQLLTREELESTMAGLADSDAPAIGHVRLTDWLQEHANELGRTYRNEHRRRRS